MANPEHVAILKQGVERWNKGRQDDLDSAVATSSLISGATPRTVSTTTSGASLRMS